MFSASKTAAVSGGYNLTRSLRFRSSASAYLNRTPASASSRTTWTWSGWVKLGSLSAYDHIFLAYQGSSASDTNYCRLFITEQTTGQLQFGGGVTNWLVTNSVYRDPSAWYHIVIGVDTTQATASNRLKLYVNGSQITSFASATYPAQNATLAVNANWGHYIGYDAGSNYFDGYMTEINFVDGQQLTPSSFGQTSSSTGVWQPKKYTGTYGTNGFYLPFTDNSALTSGSNAGLGKDFSGNGNYWNTNNISITSGATYDSMTDVPTLTSATAANFAVLNPLFSSSAGVFTLSDGNISFSAASAATNSFFSRSTFGVSSGKWYWEVTPTNVGGGPNIYIGIQDATYSPNSGTFNQAPNAYVYVYDGTKLNNATSSAYGASYTNNDVIGIALDMDGGTLTFYKNNVSQGTAYTGLSGSYSPAIGLNVGGASRTIAGSFNAGQRPFTYTPPSGYVALNTFNLPTPTIGATSSTQANKYMDVSLYTGTGSTQSITNVGGFQP